MPLIHTGLNFNRFVKQVSYGPGAVLGTYALAEANADALTKIEWSAVDETISEIPPLNFTTNPVSEAFDAYKYASDYADGKQKVYAGAVAYKIKLPADAYGADDVVGVTVRLHVDRWLIGGARIAAYLSDSELPDEDWETCREGDVYEDAVLPATDPRSDQQADVELTFPASSTATKYLYVVLSLEDLQSVSPLDVRRLEGGAQLVGILTAVEFDADVTADAETPKSFTAVAEWKDTTDYYYSMSITSAAIGVTSPKGWWSALQSRGFTFSGTQSSDTTIGLLRETALPTSYRVLSKMYTRFGITPKLTNLISLNFVTAISAPSTGVVIRIIGYLDSSQTWGDGTDPQNWRWSPIGTEAEGKDSVCKLLDGRATTFVIHKGIAGTDYVTNPISKFFDVEITKAVAANFEWPININVTGTFRMFFVVTVSRIIGNPGETLDTLYGLSWEPDAVILKANENEPV